MDEAVLLDEPVDDPLEDEPVDVLAAELLDAPSDAPPDDEPVELVDDAESVEPDDPEPVLPDPDPFEEPFAPARESLR